jgi:hypothetical protein
MRNYIQSEQREKRSRAPLPIKNLPFKTKKRETCSRALVIKQRAWFSKEKRNELIIANKELVFQKPTEKKRAEN